MLTFCIAVLILRIAVLIFRHRSVDIPNRSVHTLRDRSVHTPNRSRTVRFILSVFVFSESPHSFLFFSTNRNIFKFQLQLNSLTSLIYYSIPRSILHRPTNGASEAAGQPLSSLRGTEIVQCVCGRACVRARIAARIYIVVAVYSLCDFACTCDLNPILLSCTDPRQLAGLHILHSIISET